MSAEREKMIATLKEHVVPVLKSRGFKGLRRHRRTNNITGANAGGPRLLQVRTLWAAHIPQFCRSAE